MLVFVSSVTARKKGLNIPYTSLGLIASKTKKEAEKKVLQRGKKTFPPLQGYYNHLATVFELEREVYLLFLQCAYMLEEIEKNPI